MRPRFALGSGLAALTLVITSATLVAQDADGTRPRSVVFYLIDTCRGDRTSVGGYERPTTPFLEWLAERAVVFEDCYSQAPWTKPSMASILSSRYPSEHGLYRMQQRMSEDTVTWPEVLRANGLFTAGFSANIVMGDTLSGFAQGFDHFVEATDVNRGDAIRFASGSAKKLNEHAFAWLASTDHWPMLLYLHSVDPHEEYEPEPAYLQRFADPGRHPSYREDWKTLLADRPPIPGLLVTRDNFDRTGVDADAFIEHGSNLYDADILANDDQLQALWDELQSDGWGDDLVLVVTSDHGEEFFEHGGTSHGTSLYDEMVRVPLMIYAPGLVPAGRRIDTPVSTIDIFPTLCDLLGFEVPDGLRGESLVPLMTGAEDTGEQRAVFSQHREDPVLRRIGHGTGVMVGLRSGRWKYILNEVGSQLLEKPRHELYDLESDPREQHNVADEHPELVERFEADVASFLAEVTPEEPDEDTPELDPQVLEQLRALGYIGDEAPGEAAEDVWAAMETKDLELIRRTLAAGADPDQLESESGVSPLSIAAMLDQRALARMLLEHGADVDVRNADGATPLIGAAFLGRVEMLEFLLEQGADPDARNVMGDTAISVTRTPWNVVSFVASLLEIELDRASVEEGRERCAALLAALGERSDDPTARLFAALGTADAAAVAEALADGADLTVREAGKGWTPLSKAVFLGHEDLARLLLDHGASVQAPNRDGGSPLHSAAARGDAPLLELLIARGADVAAQDAQRSTPLHVAAFLGRSEAAGVLLREGADAAAKDVRGQTPLDLTAADWQTTQFVLQLLGLDEDRTRIEQGRLEVAERLKEPR